jgi:RNA polymerase sigma factor (sigma-70 family)
METKSEIVAFTESAPKDAEATLDFRVFFEEEHRRLYKTLYFVTGDRSEAADLMQDAFLKLWERWDRIPEIEDPVAYLFRIALNGSRMRARGLRRAALRPLPMVSSRDPFEDVDMRDGVHRMLKGLAPRQRAALVLLDMYGYGSEEAARILGVRPSTVRALATQGRAALRAKGGTDA